MRRRIVTLLVVLGVAATGLKPCAIAAQRTAGAALTVKIAGLRNAKGRVDVLLFNSPKGFPDDEPNALDDDEVQIDPKTLTAEVIFRNLPPGTYAVVVLHDENMNRKLDTHFFGIPKEGYGMSMNPPKMFRTPGFDEAKFFLGPEAREIQIRLIYY
jgi:uncharacterized protein (DUF2141 family)